MWLEIRGVVNMKIFICKNFDCDTKEHCILLVDSKAADPTMCPFDSGPRIWDREGLQEHLISEWIEEDYNAKHIYP